MIWFEDVTTSGFELTAVPPLLPASPVLYSIVKILWEMYVLVSSLQMASLVSWYSLYFYVISHTARMMNRDFLGGNATLKFNMKIAKYCVGIGTLLTRWTGYSSKCLHRATYFWQTVLWWAQILGIRNCGQEKKSFQTLNIRSALVDWIVLVGMLTLGLQFVYETFDPANIAVVISMCCEHSNI